MLNQRTGMYIAKASDKVNLETCPFTGTGDFLDICEAPLGTPARYLYITGFKLI